MINPFAPLQREAYEAGKQDERAAMVKYLRSCADGSSTLAEKAVLLCRADSIEKGEHVK